MRQISLALMAAGLLAVSALPAAASGQKSDTTGISKSQIGSVDLSARRRHRVHRYGYYRPHYRSYYRPYYAYGPGPYYYGYRPYYRPAPFPFFPFFF